MTILVSYDIESDQLRLQTANKLLEFGFIRLQQSVFAGSLTETLFARFVAWTNAEVTPHFGPDDKLFYLPLSDGQASKFIFLPSDPSDWSELLKPPNSLFV